MAENQNEPQKPTGLLFKEAREAKGISLETVHDATKIPLDVLKAIEEGYTVRTITPFYLKAFKKKYAEYLGVDVNEVVQNYKKEKLPKPIQTVKEDQAPLVDFEKIFTPERQILAFKIGGGLLILFLVIKIFGCVFSPNNSNSSKAIAIKADTKQLVKAKEEEAALLNKKEITPKPKPKEEPPKKATPTQEPKAQAQKSTKVDLTVKAKKKVWLQVKVDNNLVFQSTLHEGVSERWNANKDIEIAGRNIGYLELKVNGNDLGLLGRKNRDARRVLITSDGLTVKQ